VAFTKHAIEKFDLLDRFGFKLSQDQVVATVTNPDRTERKGAQTFSMKALDKEFAKGSARGAQRHYSGDNLLSREEEEAWPIG
jgi:hypothetical protein